MVQVRQGINALEITNGPCSTGEGVGSADATRMTRASISLRGLLALPDSEAIYFNAATDSDGNALDGACNYTVRGGAIDARWWTLTAYDPDGYLIADDGKRYSYGSSKLAPDIQDDWQVTVGPSVSDSIATDPAAPFQLTLRAYHPSQALLETRASTALPQIEKTGCPE